MPRPLLVVAAILVAASLVPLSWLLRARTSGSVRPRLQVVWDMDSQPKYRAQAASDFFADGRAMRLPVEGTVARGALYDDAHFEDGRTSGDWATTFPMPLDLEVLERGRERFDIYCAVCHGAGGRGDGMVARRATRLAEGTWTPPSDITADPIAAQPVGQIYNTVRHGIRKMPGYGSQIPTRDRWAIVGYVRALQRSTRGRLQDVPEDQRDALR